MTRILHNPNLTEVSKKLRAGTKEENKLWYELLKGLDVTFKRQKPIGKYVVDFYCPSAKLVIELDGSQHYEDEGIKKDKERDEYLNSLGITVVRYSNLDINTKFKEVCADILFRIGK